MILKSPLQIELPSNQNYNILVFRFKVELHVRVKIELTFKKVFNKVTLR